MKPSLLFLISLCFLSFSCQKPEPIHDIVIIGGGLMGSSTAWHLSQAGQQLLLLEMQDSVYTYGSSFGEARIARSNNRGNDIWSYLHNRSVEETQALISFLQSQAAEGDSFAMEDIYTTAGVSYIGRSQILDQLQASLERQEVIHVLATNQEEGSSYFDANLPEDVVMMREYNEYSGTLNPKALISHLHTAVRTSGNEIRYNHKVVGLAKNDSIFTIQVEHTQSGEQETIKTRKLVSAAGPYTGRLLEEMAPYFSDLITPQRVFLAFFEIESGRFAAYDSVEKRRIFEAYPVINSSAGTREGSFFFNDRKSR